MFVVEAHSFRQQARLAITLAWIAGYTNIASVLVCGHVTSHASGTTSDVGRWTAEGLRSLFQTNAEHSPSVWPPAAFALFLLTTFSLGAAMSGLITELARRRAERSIYVWPIAVS
jgi:uncharacterized membrane protein YoaK (UPF0700 family)